MREIKKDAFDYLLEDYKTSLINVLEIVNINFNNEGDKKTAQTGYNYLIDNLKVKCLMTYSIYSKVYKDLKARQKKEYSYIIELENVLRKCVEIHNFKKVI